MGTADARVGAADVLVNPVDGPVHDIVSPVGAVDAPVGPIDAPGKAVDAPGGAHDELVGPAAERVGLVVPLGAPDAALRWPTGRRTAYLRAPPPRAMPRTPNVRPIAARRAASRRTAAAVALLGTALPAAGQTPAPQGGEFRVNTTTAGDQSLASVALDADGDAVVAWNGDLGSPTGPASAIFARRYDAEGDPQGDEFQVSTFTSGFHFEAAVAMDADGDFVVVWTGTEEGGGTLGVYGRRHDRTGSPLGGVFLVNTTTTNHQTDPSVAMDDDGDFVVVWTGPEGSGSGVFAQRYSASGERVGGEFRVNTFTTGSQNAPAVAMDDDGDALVVWTSGASTGAGQDGSQFGVYAQRYVAGVAAGSEFRVNTATEGAQSNPSVGMDVNGDVVVVWESEGQDGSESGVYGQRYSGEGATVGPEFRVNGGTSGDQLRASVGVSATGEFAVVWESGPLEGPGPDGDRAGIYGQAYDAAGAPQGGEFQVNTYTTGTQDYPSVAVSDDGDLVVAWDSHGQDSSTYGVYAQRYRTGTVATEPGAPAGRAFSLSPNPVGAGGGAVRLTLPEAGPVRVSVVDALGREVAVPLDGVRAAGAHAVPLDTSRLPAGVYVVRLVAGGMVTSTRLVVAR
ncbi:MAG TPA: T9SS type A sorting domain-containing protein [Rubricoccaceae bacterium]